MRPTFRRETRAWLFVWMSSIAFCTACNGSGGSQPGNDGGNERDGSVATDAASDGAVNVQPDAAVVADAGVDAGPCGAGQLFCDEVCVNRLTNHDHCGSCMNACSASEECTGGVCLASFIRHVVVIVQENHTFDSYFGNYCTAPARSNPSCTTGRACCEAVPATEPAGASPILLDDTGNATYDRNHNRDCEISQVDNGFMDQFVSGSLVRSDLVHPCSRDINFSVASESTLGDYFTLADNNALADRYFQPALGGSASNDMYFASARFKFIDNAEFPNTKGSGCAATPGAANHKVSWTGETTIADLLINNGNSFKVYADGYADLVAAAPTCPAPASDCPFSLLVSACIADPSDVPFQYYAQFADNPAYIRDLADFAVDVNSGNLPNFAYIKGRTYNDEHPGWSTLTRGIDFTRPIIDAVLSSAYASSTLILLTWDEGGGFFDHVTPPAPVDVMHDSDAMGQAVPYGTRVPLIAIGPFARHGSVSHVQMEHSSILRFLEYNFIGPSAVGALGARDAVVNNIGSLLDPTTTGIPIPETN